jgi:hypothetical protein
MNKRVLSLVSTTAVALALGTPAARADDVMNACIDAFVAQHVPKDRTVRIRKIDATSPFTGVRAQRITLEAKGARSGKTFAAATCIVSSDGKSVMLKGALPQMAAAAH